MGTRPAAWYHLLRSTHPLVLLVNGSRLFQVEDALYAALEAGSGAAESELREATEDSVSSVNQPEVRHPSSISLNLIKSCNLSCSYCYADKGRFGGNVGRMSSDVAAQAIDDLIRNTKAERIVVGFIGGEPFLNADTMHFAVKYAKRRAAETGLRVGFSVTTNGTLLQKRDLELLRDNAFTVTVSVDGNSVTHNRVRPLANGKGSYSRLIGSVTALLDDPGSAKLSARSTVTRLNLDIADHIESISALGFTDVGVSPLRSSPSPGLAICENDWPVYLAEMRRAASIEWDRLMCGLAPRFSNLHDALNQIHMGACRPLPCGSVANYISVSAEGDYFSCHRTIDTPAFAMGNVSEGLNKGKQVLFLAERHVDSQEPCRTCWARYLCGGACHAEVSVAGRSGCDFIRGWLETCLAYYDRVLREAPSLLRGGKELA